MGTEWQLFLFICTQNDAYHLKDVPAFCLLVVLGLEDITEIILGSFFIWMKPGVSINYLGKRNLEFRADENMNCCCVFRLLFRSVAKFSEIIWMLVKKRKGISL